MYRYDDYVNLTDDPELPSEIRNKCLRIISISDNLEDIIVVHDLKLYTIKEKHIIGPCYCR
ncbi:hypothetical protein KQI18_01025 [Clostridioides mangenotii]|uniref:hypothetical protein n=1 Tax=Metaclostridioides mangenotii TaxID=1540 RepID=UPI001C121270|nr:MULTISPECIES: hypothetical protein [Clostridioides]MBS5788267.1 hypothetical protein [Clostridioides difficile]MBU5306355.1 hypothetical protein [Clostridioides mangenotii]